MKRQQLDETFSSYMVDHTNCFCVCKLQTNLLNIRPVVCFFEI